MHNHLNVKLDGITNHVGTLERNLEAITLHVQKLDTQVAQIAQIAQIAKAVKRSTGELHGKPEPNPRGREFVNFVVQSNGESSSQCNTLKAQKKTLEEEDVADATTAFGDLNIARGTSSSLRGKTLIERAELITQQPVIQDLTRRFKETMSFIPRGTSFEEAWERYSLKDNFTGISPKKELVEQMYEMMKPANNPNDEDDYWPLTPLNWIAKKNDPGKFTISCTIWNKEFSDCLCDTGSCNSIIPKLGADRIGITIYQESDAFLSMANTTAIPLLGKIHTVPVRIGNHTFHTDFHVVDTGGDRSASIILGRPFLATVRAMIDLPRNIVTFTNIGPFCIYPAIPTEFSLHEATLDDNSNRKPKSRRKGDYKGKKTASKANEGIVVKGPDIKVREEASRSCSSGLENTPSEYCTNEMTVADVNKFGDTEDPTLTHPELELSGVPTTSDRRSVTAAS